MTLLSPSQQRFASAAIRKKRLFRALSIAGVVAAVLLAGETALGKWRDPTRDVGARSVIVVLILLNARQNLRQYRYAGVLERTTKKPSDGAS